MWLKKIPNFVPSSNIFCLSGVLDEILIIITFHKCPCVFGPNDRVSDEFLEHIFPYLPIVPDGQTGLGFQIPESCIGTLFVINRENRYGQNYQKTEENCPNEEKYKCSAEKTAHATCQKNKVVINLIKNIIIKNIKDNYKFVPFFLSDFLFSVDSLGFERFVSFCSVSSF